MTAEQIRESGRRVAGEMKLAGSISAELRARFIAVRTALFERGIFDPVLVRFDSATVPAAPAAEVAEHLEAAAAAIPE